MIFSIVPAPSLMSEIYSALSHNPMRELQLNEFYVLDMKEVKVT